MADDIKLVIGVDNKGVLSAIKSTEALESKVKKLSDTYARGGISSGRYQRGLDALSASTGKAKKELQAYGTQIRAAEKSSKMAAASAKQETAAVKAYALARRQALEEDRRRDAVVKSNIAALNQQRMAYQANTKELYRIRMATDSVFAAEQKLLKVKKLLRAEVANGNMTMRQAARVQMDYKQSLTNMSNGLVQGRNKMNKFGMVSQQVGYQVGDFFVQVQSGQSAMVALAQQGTQLAGLLPGIAGAVVGIGLSFSGMVYQMLRGKDKAKEASDGIQNSFSKLPEFFDSLGVDIAKSFDKAFAEVESKYGKMFARLARIKLEETKSSIGQSFKETIPQTVEPSFMGRLGAALAPGMAGGNIQALENIQAQTDALYAQSLAVQEIQKSYLKSVDAAATFEDILTLTKDTEEQLASISQESADAFIKQAEKLGLIRAEVANKTLSDDKLIDEARKTSEIERLLGEQMLALERERALAQFNEDLAATNATIDAMFQNRTLYFSIRFSGDATVMGQSLEPSGKMKPTQSYEELIAMGWSPEDLARIGMDAPKVRSGSKKKGGSKESPQEKFAEYLADKQKELEIETKLVGIFDTEREIQSELFKARDEYSGVITPAQEKELENTLRQTEAIKEQQTVLEEAKAQQEALAETISGAMGDAFMSIVDGTKSAGDAFKDMAKLIISELFKILVVEKMVKSISGAISGAFGGGVDLASANGNVFNNGSHVQAYANGGVVGGPTYFPMSGGKTGLMGEAGPEAIMPLKRGSNGKLGVQMEGGATTTVVQNFNFQANGDDSVKKLIAQAAPKIAQMTKSSLLDDRRRGGTTKAAFG